MIILGEVNRKGICLKLGKQGEHNVTFFQFDYTEWKEKYGDGTLSLRLTPHGASTAYPVILEYDGTIATYTVTKTDTSVAGDGKAELVYIVGEEEKIKKSVTYETYVEPSETTGEAPEPYDDWLAHLEVLAGEVVQAKDDAEQAAESAGQSAISAQRSEQNAARSEQNAEEYANRIENLTVSAHEASGTTPTVTKTIKDDVYNLLFGLVRGEKGNKGDKGDTGNDGVTPDISIGEVETLSPSEDAYVNNTGTKENPVFDFGIPKGETGEVSMADFLKVAVTDEASGSLVTIPDGANLPMRSLKVTLEPIQSGSGTPSPDNVRPISGYDEVSANVVGINVWDEEWELGQLESNGTVSPSTARIVSKNFIPVVAGSEYYMTKYSASSKGRGAFYDSSHNLIQYFGDFPAGNMNTWNFTVPSGASFLKFCLPSGYGTTYKNDISINYPSTDHDYHSGTSNATYTADLPQTVYGGTVDLVSGELVIDRAIFKPTSISSVGTSSGKYYWVVTQTLTPPAPSNNVADLKSSHFVLGGVQEGKCYVTGNGQYIVSVPADQTLNTKALADAWMAENRPEYCYKLATPQTIQLTPQEIRTLLGTNNVWSNGDTYIKYIADTGLFIVKKIDEAINNG